MENNFLVIFIVLDTITSIKPSEFFYNSKPIIGRSRNRTWTREKKKNQNANTNNAFFVFFVAGIVWEFFGFFFFYVNKKHLDHSGVSFFGSRKKNVDFALKLSQDFCRMKKEMTNS